VAESPGESGRRAGGEAKGLKEGNEQANGPTELPAREKRSEIAVVRTRVEGKAENRKVWTRAEEGMLL